MTHTATRYHDFSYGHSVLGHESVCAHIHGHNGRVHFTVQSQTLDAVGRVMDFGDIGKRLCNWVEHNWDHRFLISQDDPRAVTLMAIDKSVVWVPFNPTAENMAKYLVHEVGPRVLYGLSTVLTSVTLEETRKCSATYTCSFDEARQLMMTAERPVNFLQLVEK